MQRLHTHSTLELNGIIWSIKIYITFERESVFACQKMIWFNGSEILAISDSELIINIDWLHTNQTCTIYLCTHYNQDAPSSKSSMSFQTEIIIKFFIRFNISFLSNFRTGHTIRWFRELDTASEIFAITWLRCVRVSSEYGTKNVDGIQIEYSR